MPLKRSIATAVFLLLFACAAASTAPPPVTLPEDAVDAGAPTDISEAELLRRIRQAITEDLQRANLLRVRARHLQLEFEMATAEFDVLDAQLQQQLSPAAQARAQDDRHAAETAGGPEAGVVPPSLERRWRWSRDRLDVLLQRRQVVEQQLQVLHAKESVQDQALQLVVGQGDEPADDPAAATSPADAPETAADDAGASTDSAKPSAGSAAGRLSLLRPERGAAGLEVVPLAPVPEVYDSRVARAEREQQRHEAGLRRTERMARIVESLVALDQDELALLRSAVVLTSRHLELLVEADDLAGPDGEDMAAFGIDPPVLRVAAQRARQSLARDEQRIETLDGRLEILKTIRVGVQDLLAAHESAFDAARRRLAFLQSPLAPHRLLNWSVRALPRIAVLLGLLALLWLVGRWLARRLVDAALTRIRRTADEERVQRVETLRRALRSAITVLLALVGALIILPEFGVDATVLMGSAAVLSLAIAFGAQSLVKDYFSGFMVLSENQYRIGNVVRINDVAGVVEDISLRMSMLRDAEGVAHFIPHSEIRMVSNLTHGWAQAMVDVRVGYAEDIDRVMQALDELAREMQHDEVFGPLVLADPELWGVEALTETAVVVRLVMRTRPMKQWQVKRELLRRIKNRFDALGIRMDLPQIVMRMPGTPAAGTGSDDAGRQP